MYFTYEYKLSHHLGRRHFLRSLRSGWVPVLFCASIFFKTSYELQLWLFMVAGLAISGMLLMHAIYRLHEAAVGKPPWLAAFIKRSDHWFPGFVMLGQHCFASLTIWALWIIVASLGFPSGFFLSSLLLLLLVAILVRRIILHYQLEAPLSTGWEMLYHLSGATQWICGILFAAWAATRIYLPYQVRPTDESKAAFLFIWVPAVIFILSIASMCWSNIRRLIFLPKVGTLRP